VQPPAVKTRIVWCGVCLPRHLGRLGMYAWDLLDAVCCVLHITGLERAANLVGLQSPVLIQF
jgi:hypothetical protein